MKKILLALVLTASGLLSGFLYGNRFMYDAIHLKVFSSKSDFVFYALSFMGFLSYAVFPGILFGLTFGLYLKFKEKISLRQIIVLIGYSCLAWFVAYLVGFFSMGLLIIGSGIIGALIVVSGVQRTIIRFTTIYYVAIVGAIAGIVFMYAFDPEHSNNVLMYGGFAVWQVMVGVMIDVLIDKHNYNQSITESSQGGPTTIQKNSVDTYVVKTIIVLAVLMIAVIYILTRVLCLKVGRC